MRKRCNRCVHCDNPFKVSDGRRRIKRFCSARCKQAWYRLKQSLMQDDQMSIEEAFVEMTD